jgi:hypothetical protein
MSKFICSDNPATGRIGCGATGSGETQHCVAKVTWSTQPDGRAHISARLSTIDFLWAKGTDGQMANPADYGITPDSRGYWRRPADPANAERLARLKEANK